MNSNIGIYIHIPFCDKLCHYCDFAKTSIFDKSAVQGYFDKLYTHMAGWLLGCEEKSIDSVFFGGGTPGLFCEEFEPIFDLISPFLSENCEISLEANPNNLTLDRLERWRRIGFNRLSLGIQSFQSKGLVALTRDHDESKSYEACEMALTVFDNTNIDMIYGWPNQTMEDWGKDLKAAITLGVPHLSLYNLTYEGKTPIGRRFHRGLIEPHEESFEEALYGMARKMLIAYEHDEVSNWSMKNYSCRHNWLYWSMKHFYAFGVGAHGFLPLGDFGVRFSYPKSLIAFYRLPQPNGFDLMSRLQSSGVDYSTLRSKSDWLVEVIGCGLRTRKGIAISEIEARLGCSFEPRNQIKTAVSEGKISISANGVLTLSKAEWFRENSWAVELIQSFPSVD